MMLCHFRRTLVACLLLMAPHIADADEWGHKLRGLPTQFIFGYGSLIDAKSRDKTAGAILAAIPVRVSASFGYLRAWVDRCPCGFTALGLRRARSGESAMTINGVIYPVSGSDLPAFDQREKGYRRILVPRNMIEAVSWQGLPDIGEIWVYVPVGPTGEPGVDLPEPTPQFPMLQSYIDLVLRGASSYSPDFAREAVETTADWSPYWLNDRELPRRPWVFSNDYRAIDAILEQTAPASTRLHDRLFPEDFSARNLMSAPRPR